MSIAFVFPGQGEQKPGMGKDIYDAYPDKRYILDDACDILGEDIKDICFNDDDGSLYDGRISSVAVFSISALIYDIVKDAGIVPDFYAGYSIGQHGALYAAGALPFEESLKLMNFRGECMKKCSARNISGMVGVIGLNEDKIEEIIIKTGKEAYIANYNGPGNCSISYHNSAKDRLWAELEKADAMKIVELPVAGAWHSPLMRDAAEMFRPVMFSQPFKTPHKGFIDTYSVDTVKSVDELKTKLYHHVCHPVRWHESIKKMINMGADTFVEIGFGNQLSRFIKFIDRKVKIFYTEKLSDLQKTIEILTEDNL